MARNNPKQKMRQQLRQRHQNRIAHREERETKERERFIATPTPKQARHQAMAETNQEYSPVIRGIRGELASSRAKQKYLTNSYNQLGSEMAQAAQANEGAANAYSSSLTQQLAQANAQNAQTLAAQQAANQQFSATTGIPQLASSGQAAAAGANIGNLENVALNAPVQAAQRAQSGYLRNIGAAQRMEGVNLAGQQFGARKAIRQDLQAAQKQKGQAYVGHLNEQRESARKQALDAKALEVEGEQTRAQEALEQEKLQQDERQNQRSAALTARGQNVTAANSAASTAASTRSANASARNARVAEEKFQAEQAYKREHGGRTPAEVAAARKEGQPSQSAKEDKREALQNGYAAAKQAIAAYGKAPAQYSAAEWLALEQHLTAPRTGREPGAGLDPAVARKVIAALRRRAERSKPVVEAASGLGGFG